MRVMYEGTCLCSIAMYKLMQNVCMYVCMYVCMHVCMYVRTYVCNFYRCFFYFSFVPYIGMVTIIMNDYPKFKVCVVYQISCIEIC